MANAIWAIFSWMLKIVGNDHIKNLMTSLLNDNLYGILTDLLPLTKSWSEVESMELVLELAQWNFLLIYLDLWKLEAQDCQEVDQTFAEDSEGP